MKKIITFMLTFLLVFNSVIMVKPAYAEEETDIIETDGYEISEEVSDEEEDAIFESDEEEIENLSTPEQEPELEMVYYPREMTFQSDEQEDNEELVKGYINSLLYDRLVEMEKPINLFDGYEIQGKKGNGNKLKGANAVFYNQLSAMISKVAAGEIVSTEFSIDSSLLNLTKTSWTAEELGVDSLVDENNYITLEAQNAVNTEIGFDLDLLMNTLLADHPYELYWYDKTHGVSLVSGYSADETSLYIGGSFVFYFSTAYEYAVKVEDNQYKLYEIDPSTGNTIENALVKADSIVSAYSGKNDLEKLYAYKNEICQMVDYNSEAVEYDQQYGNPWQLIWVFDENSSTKVVCEGYSKAFQYLCDLTDFEHDDICAYVVTGLMGGGTGEGNHMWNIVRMDDYKNYLVDVTNCDAGSIGEEDKLFLVGTENTGNSTENGYTFNIDDTSVTYKYDEITKRIYKSNELELANGTYSGSAQYSPTDGTAYAVLTNEGDLIFFRSLEEYENGKEYTVKDIKNEAFTGKVYTGIETVNYNYFNSVNVPWSEDASKIKYVYVSEGQTIKPLSLNGWFMLTKSLIDVNLKGIDSSLVEDMSVMFVGSAIENADLSCLDTSNVTNMYWTFRECWNLKSVNFGIDTSKVSDMGGLFSRCLKLETVDLSSLNTSSLKDISGLFSECSSLKSVTFGNFDTSSVTDISWLFQDCTAIQNIDLSAFRTSAVKNMNGMFKGCSALEKINISGFDTSAVTMMSSMFEGCDSLKTVILGSGFTKWSSDAYLPSGTWTNGNQFLSEAELVVQYPSHASEWKGTWEKVIPVTSITLNKTSLELALGNKETLSATVLPEDATNKKLEWSSNNATVAAVDENGVVTAISSGTTMISVKALGGNNISAQVQVKVLSDTDSAYAILTSEGDLIFFRSSEVYENGKEYTATDIDGNQYQGKVYSGIEQTEYEYFSSNPVLVPWDEDRTQIRRSYVTEGQTIRPLSLSGWFLGCTFLTDVDFNGYDISAVKDMSALFASDKSLSYVDLSPLNTQNVTTMYWLFRDCKNLTDVILDNDTSKVTDMGGMFSRCNKLETIDLSSLNLFSLTDISGMFAESPALRTVNFGSINTASVTDMSWLFQDCTSLREIDLSSFDTSSVESLIGMFKGCNALERIDISNFNTSNVARMSNMFLECDSLTNIKLGAGFTNWTNEAYLPEGNWTNGNLVKSEIELYEQYPGNASAWNGEWILAETGFQIIGLHDFTYSPSVKSYVYDTDDIRVYYGNKLLSLGADYTIKYANNTKVPQSGSEKLPSITITGKGNYSGTLTKTFDIRPLSLSEDNASVVLNRDSFIYNGKTQRPTVSVTYNGTTLKNKSDYTLEYADPVLENVYHEGSVKVVFKGNYEGEITKTYRIFEKDTLIPMPSLKVSGIKPSLAYTGSEVLQNLEGIRITYGKTLLVKDRDYTVSYENNIDAGITYIIFEGTQNLSNDDAFAGTLTKSFRITPVSLSSKNTSVEGISASYPYSGQAIKPSPVFKYGDKTLVEDQDYTITYKNNIKAGMATVTLKGINNYKGTITRTFTIGKIDLSKANVSLDASYRYEKGGTKPLPVITYDGKTLVYNNDYTLSYKNNTKLGTATLTVKGKGNYAGTVTKSFVILSKPIDDDSITVQIPDKVYSTKANGWKSSPVLTDSNGKKLSAGSDYNKVITYTYVYDTKVLDGSSKLRPEIIRRQGEEVQKNDILPVNTLIKVTINTDNLKLNNYIGTIAKTYRIVQADLSKASVTIPIKYYTGRPVTLSKSEITVKVNKQILSSDDYDIICYENNTAKGTAKVTLKGKGNYGGYKTISFKINQRSLGITIHFDGNGATSGSMKDQTLYKETKLTKVAFKKIGFEFMGWNTKEDGTGDNYGNNELFYDPDLAGKVITLYAMWGDPNVRVHFSGPVDNAPYEIEEGYTGTLQLMAGKDSYPLHEDIAYSSSDTSIASVDQKGLVTFTGRSGIVKIIARTTDGSNAYDEAVINVSESSGRTTMIDVGNMENVVDKFRANTEYYEGQWQTKTHVNDKYGTLASNYGKTNVQESFSLWTRYPDSELRDGDVNFHKYLNLLKYEYSSWVPVKDKHQTTFFVSFMPDSIKITLSDEYVPYEQTFLGGDDVCEIILDLNGNIIGRCVNNEATFISNASRWNEFVEFENTILGLSGMTFDDIIDASALKSVLNNK